MDTEKIPYGNAGFIAIVGRPNVGKSSLLNKILNFHLAPVSSRPHTTRKNCLGIYSDEKTQIVFLDTPGIHKMLNNEMNKTMHKNINRSLQEADHILCMMDSSREFGNEDKLICELLENKQSNTSIVYNKIDICSIEEINKHKEEVEMLLPSVKHHFMISCHKEIDLDTLTSHLQKQMPEGNFFFPPNEITNIFTRNIAEELIRETANDFLSNEIPHSLAIIINSWNESAKNIKINCIFYLERRGQQAIVIGSEGNNINKIIKIAREKINVITQKFIHLKVQIKIKPKWKDNKNFLKSLGLE